MTFRRTISLLIILLGFIFRGGYAQTSYISGQINQYAAVEAIYATDESNDNDSVLVRDLPPGFGAGDTVMLYCVKGAEIKVSDDPDIAGDIYNRGFNTGKYTFIIIKSISTNRDTVVFNTDLDQGTGLPLVIRPLLEGEVVQLIRVPSYRRAVVVDKVTAPPWDGHTGGVVAMLVSTTLTLNQDIDVTGKGFRGGEVTETTTAVCTSTDTTLYDSLFYHRESELAGEKGEGFTDTLFALTRGKAKNINGGGGGNGRLSGGGGGSNYSLGGKGGYESGECGPVRESTGGFGGLDLDSEENLYMNFEELPSSPPAHILNWNQWNRIFFGGGGGAGRQLPGTPSSAGGRGGGVVVIIADTIVGNGGGIIADGAGVTDAVTGAGGGGGGGGAIVLDVSGYKNYPVLSAVGGDGGDTNDPSNATGPGGGGGGGVYWYAGEDEPDWTTSTSESDNGEHIFLGPLGASEGDPDASKPGLEIPTAGFMFNFVPTEFWVCSNQVPDTIFASRPKGGDGVYHFEWVDSSSTQNEWQPVVGAEDTLHLGFDTPLDDTTYYRRIVTSAGLDPDTSFRIALYVHPVITNNLITDNDTVCRGNEPELFGPVGGPPWIDGGPTGGTIIYRWQQMEDGSGGYSDVTAALVDSTYQPPGQTISSDFRRIAIAGACIDTSNELHVRVLDTIGGNEITPFDTICVNTTPDEIHGPIPSGGEPADIRYQWLSSTSSQEMGSVVAGEVDTAYQSPALGQTSYFRRIVLSGNDNACRDTSDFVEVLVIPDIENYKLESNQDQTVCQFESALAIDAQTASGGNGTFIYHWEAAHVLSSDWDMVTLKGPDQIDYDPGIMDGDSTMYRRWVGSGGSASNVCVEYSDTAYINVHPAITGDSITPSDTVCFGDAPGAFNPAEVIGGGPDGGLFTYQWIEDNGSGMVDIVGETDPSFQSAALTDTTQFARITHVGVCTDTSNVITTIVHSTVNNNTILDTRAVCYGETRLLPETATPVGSDLIPIYRWRRWLEGETPADADTIFDSNQQEYTAGPFISPGIVTRYFDRVVEIGKCTSISDPMVVTVMQLPGGRLTEPDFDSCSGYLVDLAVMLNLNPGSPGYAAEPGSYPWTVTLKNDLETGIGPFTLNRATVGSREDTLTGIRISSDGATYVQYPYEIESILYHPEGDDYTCVAPSDSITGGPVVIGVFRTPEPQIFGTGVVNDNGKYLKVCDSSLTMQIDDPDQGAGHWIFEPAEHIFYEPQAGSAYKVSIDKTVKEAYTEIGESPYRAIFSSTAGTTGCVGKDSIRLYLFEQPAQANAGEDTTLFLIDTIHLKAEPATAGYGFWDRTEGEGEIADPNSANTLVTKLGMKMENMFLWTVMNGEDEGTCITTDSITTVVRTEINSFNGFSPNGDMDNEYFIMRGLEYADQWTINFFNSLGKPVRTITHEDAAEMEINAGLIRNGLRADERVAWDGKASNGNLVPSGTYYYVIHYINDQESYEIKDYVVVVRE